MSTLELIEFRTFQPADLDQVRALDIAAFQGTDLHGRIAWDDADDLEDIPAHYMNNRGDFLVGLVGEEIVTMGGFNQHSETEAEIRRMRVKKELQGQRIGPHLLKLLEDGARELGYMAAVLDTTVEQEAAQRMYEACGYQEIRRDAVNFVIENIYYRKRFSPLKENVK